MNRLYRLSNLRWRALAWFFGGVARAAERGHDRLHRTTDPGCDMCMDRENEA